MRFGSEDRPLGVRVGARPDPGSLLRTVSCSGELAGWLRKGQPVALEERGARHGKEGRGTALRDSGCSRGRALGSSQSPHPGHGGSQSFTRAELSDLRCGMGSPRVWDQKGPVLPLLTGAPCSPVLEDSADLCPVTKASSAGPRTLSWPSLGLPVAQPYCDPCLRLWLGK